MSKYRTLPRSSRSWARWLARRGIKPPRGRRPTLRQSIEVAATLVGIAKRRLPRTRHSVRDPNKRSRLDVAIDRAFDWMRKDGYYPEPDRWRLKIYLNRPKKSR